MIDNEFDRFHDNEWIENASRRAKPPVLIAYNYYTEASLPPRTKSHTSGTAVHCRGVGSVLPSSDVILICLTVHTFACSAVVI